MDSICQRCKKESFSWTIKESSFNVGKIEQWKIKLCKDCTEEVEMKLLNFFFKRED